MSDDVAAAGGTNAPAQGVSIDDELRAVHAGLVAEREPEVFELPGWRKKLQVEYRVLLSGEQDEIATKVAEEVRYGKVEDVMFIASIDTLIAACIRIYTEIDGELVPLEESAPGLEGMPIRWGDERLAQRLGIALPDKPTARLILRNVLVDDRLVAEHAQQVQVWMARALREVRTDFPNASPATPE